MHHYFRAGIRLMLALAIISSAGAKDLVFQSGPPRVSLLELYTSEGCSSCPPAEAWLSKLSQDAGLWKNYVPISFHVTYWDNLGWPDHYASPEFTERQKAFAVAWHNPTIYTPEFILNGQEWQRGPTPTLSKTDAGLLRAKLDDKRTLVISYLPASTGKKWEAHVALLGCDLATSVKAGENNGQTLHHDFVVLSFQSVKLGGPETPLVLAAAQPGEKAIAVWVTEENELPPAQAVGGWLK